MDEHLRKAALDYHRAPVAGKIAIAPTKGLVNQRDLALAYTPGVAAACEAIAADPASARDLTARAVPEPSSVARANVSRGSHKARRTAPRYFAA